MRCLESAADTDSQSHRDGWEVQRDGEEGGILSSVSSTGLLLRGSSSSLVANPHHMREPASRRTEAEAEATNSVHRNNPTLPVSSLSARGDSHHQQHDNNQLEMSDLLSGTTSDGAFVANAELTQAETDTWFTAGNLDDALASLQQYGKFKNPPKSRLSSLSWHRSADVKPPISLFAILQSSKISVVTPPLPTEQEATPPTNTITTTDPRLVTVYSIRNGG